MARSMLYWACWDGRRGCVNKADGELERQVMPLKSLILGLNLELPARGHGHKGEQTFLIRSAQRRRGWWIA